MSKFTRRIIARVEPWMEAQLRRIASFSNHELSDVVRAAFQRFIDEEVKKLEQG